MIIPQNILDDLNAAGEALSACADTDQKAAGSAAAVEDAKGKAAVDATAALEAHQNATALAQKAIQEVTEWLGSTPPAPPAGSPLSTPAPEQPERVAGRRVGQK